MAILGDTIVVGATGGNDANGVNTGSAYIYDTSGVLIKKLLPTGGSADDGFGFRLAISESIIVVTANTADDSGIDIGTAYVYDLLGNQIDKLVPSDGADNDRFGDSVALSGSTIVIGASRDDDNGSGSGSVYIY